MDAIVQIILSVIAAIATWEGGKFGVRKVKSAYANTQDVFVSEVCNLKHERIDEKLEELTALIENNAKQIQENAELIRNLAIEQEKLLSIEGPIAKLVEKVANSSSTREVVVSAAS